MKYPEDPMVSLWRGGQSLLAALADPATRAQAVRRASLARLRIQQFLDGLPKDVAAAYSFECNKLRTMQERLCEAMHAVTGDYNDNNGGDDK